VVQAVSVARKQSSDVKLPPDAKNMGAFFWTTKRKRRVEEAPSDGVKKMIAMLK
jgi:hypothetical protein